MTHLLRPPSNPVFELEATHCRLARRRFLQAGAQFSLAAMAFHQPVCGASMAAAGPPTAADLAATALIDSAHPRIVGLAAEIARGAATPAVAAVLVHDWVRDRIAFGIPAAFYNIKASDVPDVGVGYCNTKATLFSALLRALGIPTRTRMFDLSAAVLAGLFDPGTASVDHAVTEVWLHGRWIGIDSYVVDIALARAAARRLAAEGREAGYGIHKTGRSDWDGESATRIQCVQGTTGPDWIRADHGHFRDVADFYTRAERPRNRLNLLSNVFIRLGAGGINRTIDGVRQGR